MSYGNGWYYLQCDVRLGENTTICPLLLQQGDSVPVRREGRCDARAVGHHEVSGNRLDVLFCRRHFDPSSRVGVTDGAATPLRRSSVPESHDRVETMKPEQMEFSSLPFSYLVSYFYLQGRDKRPVRLHRVRTVMEKPGKVMEFLNGYFQARKSPEKKQIPTFLEKSCKCVVFICAFTLSFKSWICFLKEWRSKYKPAYALSYLWTHLYWKDMNIYSFNQTIVSFICVIWGYLL